ncbi:MAG TPA: hypothetical protein PKA59_10105 [Chakrabartia sp.]|nr:hypothetical protein [Chakrabartia sp.]
MLLPAPALPQEQGDPEEGMICLAIGRRWQGSAEETRRIETDPVPASFTAIQQSGTCAAFQLLSNSLIDWHMNFGTEASIRPALRHYAGGRFDVPEGPDWETLWRRAAPALERAEAAAADKADPIAAARVMSADKAGMALLTRIRTWQSRIEAAHHYLRAADLWQSRTLLADARPVVAWVEESALFLKSKGLLEKEGDRKPLANFLRLTSHDEEDRFGLQAHMLALKAELGGTAEESMRARDAVAALETPVLKQLMEEGWRHGDNLCDMGDRSDLAALHEACRDENDIERTLLTYAWLTVRTRSDNAPQEGRDSLYDAEFLLRRAHEAHSGTDSTALADRRSPTEPMFILLMDQARRLMKAAADPAVQTGRDTRRATSYRQAAGESLSAALQSLNPAQAPTPWRIAAQLWLSNHQAMADSLEGAETAKRDDRMAAYLRAVLAHLERAR